MFIFLNSDVGIHFPPIERSMMKLNYLICDSESKMTVHDNHMLYLLLPIFLSPSYPHKLRFPDLTKENTFIFYICVYT